MATSGAPRLGAGLLLQQRKGLRPSKMLDLLASDVALPDDHRGTAMAGCAVLGLGMRVGTKLKRPQTVLLRETEDGDIIELLCRLKSVTPASDRLFPYSLYSYRTWLKFLDQRLGLCAGWTPHSARAGYASDARALGKSFEEIREEGRWTVDSSLRVYLDVAEASAIHLRLRHSGLGDCLEWGLRHWLLFFPVARLR